MGNHLSVNEKISQILLSALNGSEREYRTDDGFVKWRIVEDEIHKVVSEKVTKFMNAFALLQKDGHQWSTRPCSTCQAVSSLIGRPFGCILYANAKRRRS